MKRLCLFLALVVIAPLVARAQPWVVGQSYFSQNGYIEYRPGNLPIIISTPHGGSLTPASIPDRTCNNPTTVTDSWTTELGTQVDTSFLNRTGCRPHLIICHLKRTKLDANRNLAEGACGNVDAETAWKAFHNWIDTARKLVTQQFEKGFYVDLHAHGHAVQQMELGYLLTPGELRKTDAQLSSGNYKDSSSIRKLASTNLTGLSFVQLLRGPRSFGTALALRGYPSVPSQLKPAPDTSESYFDGGYNTAYYTSYMGGTVDGVQIETNYTGVRDNATNRKKFADTLSVTLLAYLKEHYFGTTPSCNKPTGIGTETQPSLQIFPNPAIGGSITVMLQSEQTAAVHWSVLAVDGRVARSGSASGSLFSVSGLLPGVYLLRIDNVTLPSETQRFIVP
jgi:hypothetical protein